MTPIPDDTMVLNKRKLRAGETPQAPGYGYIDGYLVDFSDLDERMDEGLTGEIGWDAQQDAKSQLVTDPTQTARVTAPNGDQWEFQALL